MIDHLDHLVLTTAHEADCIRFYTQALGMRLETFVGGTPPVERKAFVFGAQKINLHVKDHEFEPKAHTPAPGALVRASLNGARAGPMVQRSCGRSAPGRSN